MLLQSTGATAALSLAGGVAAASADAAPMPLTVLEAPSSQAASLADRELRLRKWSEKLSAQADRLSRQAIALSSDADDVQRRESSVALREAALELRFGHSAQPGHNYSVDFPAAGPAAAAAPTAVVCLVSDELLGGVVQGNEFLLPPHGPGLISVAHLATQCIYRLRRRMMMSPLCISLATSVRPSCLPLIRN